MDRTERGVFKIHKGTEATTGPRSPRPLRSAMGTYGSPISGTSSSTRPVRVSVTRTTTKRKATTPSLPPRPVGSTTGTPVKTRMDTRTPHTRSTPKSPSTPVRFVCGTETTSTPSCCDRQTLPNLMNHSSFPTCRRSPPMTCPTFKVRVSVR